MQHLSNYTLPHYSPNNYIHTTPLHSIHYTLKHAECAVSTGCDGMRLDKQHQDASIIENPSILPRHPSTHLILSTPSSFLQVADVVLCQSMSADGTTKKRLVIMDEVDGMGGSDRGGIPELIKARGDEKHGTSILAPPSVPFNCIPFIIIVTSTC